MLLFSFIFSIDHIYFLFEENKNKTKKIVVFFDDYSPQCLASGFDMFPSAFVFIQFGCALCTLTNEMDTLFSFLLFYFIHLNNAEREILSGMGGMVEWNATESKRKKSFVKNGSETHCHAFHHSFTPIYDFNVRPIENEIK